MAFWTNSIRCEFFFSRVCVGMSVCAMCAILCWFCSFWWCKTHGECWKKWLDTKNGKNWHALFDYVLPLILPLFILYFLHRERTQINSSGSYLCQYFFYSPWQNHRCCFCVLVRLVCENRGFRRVSKSYVCMHFGHFALSYSPSLFPLSPVYGLAWTHNLNIIIKWNVALLPPSLFGHICSFNAACMCFGVDTVVGSVVFFCVAALAPNVHMWVIISSLYVDVRGVLLELTNDGPVNV